MGEVLDLTPPEDIQGAVKGRRPRRQVYVRWEPGADGATIFNLRCPGCGWSLPNEEFPALITEKDEAMQCKAIHELIKHAEMQTRAKVRPR